MAGNEFDRDESAPLSPESFVRIALLFYGGLGCVALLWRMSTPGASILSPDGATLPDLSLGRAVAAGFGVGLVALALSEALTRWTAIGEALAETLGEGLSGIGRADGILLAFASGLAEEMFFRGALQPAIGLVWASLVFGACHFLPRRELVLWSGYAVAMGLAFGLLFEFTGHLAAPVTAHIVVNAVNLPRLASRARDQQAKSGGPGRPFSG